MGIAVTTMNWSPSNFSKRRDRNLAISRFWTTIHVANCLLYAFSFVGWILKNDTKMIVLYGVITVVWFFLSLIGLHRDFGFFKRKSRE